MSLTLITAPAEEPITLTEAKAHLRRDDTADDTLISTLITAVRQNIDGAAGWLGRALISQTWELKLDKFPSVYPYEITLPLPPLVSITSVKYIDSDGAEQTLSSSVYQTVAGEPARIALAHGQSWPSTQTIPDAVRVRFVCGYGAAAAVPSSIKAALLLHLGTLYRDREATGDANAPVSLGYDALLTPYRVVW